MNKNLCEKFLRSIRTKDEYITYSTEMYQPIGADIEKVNNIRQMYSFLCELSKEYSSFYADYYSMYLPYFLDKKWPSYITRENLNRTKSFVQLLDTDIHETYHMLVGKKCVENWNVVPLEVQNKMDELDMETFKLIEPLMADARSMKEINMVICENEKKHRNEYPEVKYWEDYIKNTETILWFPFIGQNEFSIKMVQSPQFKDMIQCIPNEVVDLLHIYEPYISPDTKNKSFSSDFFGFFDEFITAGHSILASAGYIEMAYDLYRVNEERGIFSLNATVDQLVGNDCNNVEYRFLVWIEYFYFLSIYLGYSHENDHDFFKSIVNDQAIVHCIDLMMELVENQKSKYLLFKKEHQIITNPEYDNSLVIKEIQKNSFLGHLGIKLDRLLKICSSD